MRMRLGCVGFAAALCAAAASIPGAAGSKKLRVLVITGGHGYDKKTFGQSFDGLADVDLKIHDGGKKGTSSLFDDVSDWQYDVMVLYNFRQKIDEKQRKGFLSLLERGVGLVSMHHAIAAYPDWREYEKIIGATYVLKEQVRDGVKYLRPKWKHGVDMKIHVENDTHAITKGVGDFEIHDESYKLWIYHEGNKLLLSTDNPLNNTQIAWTRTHGKARVFYIQLGHGSGAYANKNFQKIVARGIRWAGKALTP